MLGTRIKATTEDKVTENLNPLLESRTLQGKLLVFDNVSNRNSTRKFIGRNLRLVLNRTSE